MSAYYNEIDPFCCQWLRNLIAKNLIAPGEVDERDIRDVKPDDLRGFEQCHFFAGIGGWSYALRLAGWNDDREVWTGSCPCQPFSAAGKRAGFADERHLWPAWHWLIVESRPRIVFGEQVASAAGRAWFDTVSTDMENVGYSCGAQDICAAGVGAPHIRQRLYFVAFSSRERCEGLGLYLQPGPSRFDQPEVGRSGEAGFLADRFRPRLEIEREQQARGECETVERSGETHKLADDISQGREIGTGLAPAPEREASDRCSSFWSECSWLPCRDGKSRPVEPGAFPLAHGIPGRVGRLRAYGNAIVPPLAAAFISAAMEVIP